MWDENYDKSLSRREREVIQIVMEHGRLSARDIGEQMADPPTYSAIRSILRLLVEKGLLVKVQEGRRDLFSLPVSQNKAKINALQNIVNRFFGKSACEAALALLGNKDVSLTEEEADKLMKLVEEARKK